MSHPYTIQSILGQLDKAAKANNIPMMDNANYPVISGRLHVYRNAKDWAIVFNMLTLDDREGITTIINSVGPGVQMVNWDEYIANMSKSDEIAMKEIDGTGGLLKFLKNLIPQVPQRMAKLNKLYAQYQEDSSKNISDNDTLILTAEYEYDAKNISPRITVRGKPLPQAEQVHYQTLQQNGGVYGIYKMSEALINVYKEQLLATPEEIAKFFPQGMPPLFLCLDEWRHPDLAAGEVPSQCETFQLIAKAICSGNPEDYAPTLQPNIDWRQWIDE